MEKNKSQRVSFEEMEAMDAENFYGKVHRPKEKKVYTFFVFGRRMTTTDKDLYEMIKNLD